MSQFHFTPEDYLDLMQAEVPAYEELQEEVAKAAAGPTVTRILELGTGTGETARRVLSVYPRARLTGLDSSGEMLAAAGELLSEDQVDDLLVRPMEEPLPAGPFDLVISALAVHHLDAVGKADLFRRVARTLRPGGRFVLGDVVVPVDPSDAVTPLTPDFDLPSSTGEQLVWLQEAGFEATVTWAHRDLAVLKADLTD